MESATTRRVVVTGLGVVSGLGIGVDALWDGLVDGRSAVGPIRQLDASTFPLRFAAEVDPAFSVRDFVPKSYRKAVKVMCRDIELAVAAAAKAIKDAGLVTTALGEEKTPTYPANRMGCQIGAGLIVAEINELTAAFAKARDETGAFSMVKWGQAGMGELTPLWMLKYLPNMLACHVTIVHDCQGPSNTITCAEASGALCVGESRRVIERGDADVCFSGGAESKISPLGLLRQWHTGMMARATPQDGDGRNVVRPFGEDARGTVPGEAGAILIVEALEHATRRGARVYAEIAGFGAAQATALASIPPKPEPTGRALTSAIRAALRDARIEGDAIDAIVPMACGAPDYDRAEAAALRAVFGERLASIPLVTIRPNVGLCAAATSSLDIAVGTMCLSRQVLPARINGERPLPGLQAATAATRDARLNHILICGTGFGGQSTAVVLRRAGS